MLAQAHPGPAGQVQIHTEQVPPYPVPLVSIERLEALHQDLVGGESVGRLRLRAPLVPCLPDGRERISAWRLCAAQPGVEEQPEDLGSGAKMAEYLRDRPVAGVGLLPKPRLVQRLDGGAQCVVRVAQGDDPRLRARFHASAPFGVGMRRRLARGRLTARPPPRAAQMWRMSSGTTTLAASGGGPPHGLRWFDDGARAGDPGSRVRCWA